MPTATAVRDADVAPASVPESAESMRAAKVSAIMGGMRRRDPAALEALYDMMSGQVFGLAYRILGDRTAAEDASQEAFLTIWRQSDRLDPARGNLTSLLMTVVHNKAIDMLRVRRRRLAGSLDGEAMRVADAAPAVIEMVTSSLERASVRRSVALLPFEQRRAVEMAYFDGRTCVEIASICGVPVGTVKSRMRLAMEKLRQTVAADIAC
jgi:RNA polymerase sigma-70 factor (ECF subfamily)